LTVHHIWVWIITHEHDVWTSHLSVDHESCVIYDNMMYGHHIWAWIIARVSCMVNYTKLNTALDHDSEMWLARFFCFVDHHDPQKKNHDPQKKKSRMSHDVMWHARIFFFVDHDSRVMYDLLNNMKCCVVSWLRCHVGWIMRCVSQFWDVMWHSRFFFLVDHDSRVMYGLLNNMKCCVVSWLRCHVGDMMRCVGQFWIGIWHTGGVERA